MPQQHRGLSAVLSSSVTPAPSTPVLPAPLAEAPFGLCFPSVALAGFLWPPWQESCCSIPAVVRSHAAGSVVPQLTQGEPASLAIPWDAVEVFSP